MEANAQKIICIILLALYGVVMLMMCCIILFKKNEKSKNNVHFYVARDMDGELWLYIAKPVRTIDEFLSCNYGKAISSKYFLKYGLNENDYDNLKWEDEPVEVFLNMED